MKKCLIIIFILLFLPLNVGALSEKIILSCDSTLISNQGQITCEIGRYII